MLSSVLIKISPAELASPPLLLSTFEHCQYPHWCSKDGTKREAQQAFLKWAKGSSQAEYGAVCEAWSIRVFHLWARRRLQLSIVDAIYTQLLHSHPKLVVGQIASLSYRFGFKENKHKRVFFFCIILSVLSYSGGESFTDWPSELILGFWESVVMRSWLNNCWQFSLTGIFFYFYT